MAVRKPAAQRKPAASASQKKQLDFMMASKQLKVPAAFLVGFGLGHTFMNFLNKNKTVKGLLGTDNKKYIVPLATTFTGLLLPQVFDMKKQPLMQYASWGFAGAGFNETVKVSTGKSVTDHVTKQMSGVMGVMGLGEVEDDMPEEIPADAMQAIEAAPANALPAADLDIEAEIEKKLADVDKEEPATVEAAAPVEGVYDNIIDSEDLGDLDDDDDEDYDFI